MPLETHPLGPFSLRVWKEGTGAPLLYFHGFETHPGDAGFLRRLAETHTVFAPECPGYGQSTGATAVEDLLDLVLFYRELINSWELTAPLDVIGHCFGGMLAAELAAVCPDKVNRLALIGSYGLWLDGVDAPDPFSLTPDELRRAKWHDPERAAMEPTITVPDPADPVAATIERSLNLAVAAKLMWPLPDRGLRKRLHLVKAPTLVVQGASDGLVPRAHAEELVRLIPQARLVEVAAAGHLPHVEQEDATAALLDAFFTPALASS